VADVMSTELRTVTSGQTQRELAAALLLEPRHNSFPVVDAADGTLSGLLLRSELDACCHASATVEEIMDRAPAIVQPEWPLERAHRLFAALGLRHLIVVSRSGRPVGMLTRHDLQQHQQHRHLHHHLHHHLSVNLGNLLLPPACRRRRRHPVRPAAAPEPSSSHQPPRTRSRSPPGTAPLLAATAAPSEGGWEGSGGSSSSSSALAHGHAEGGASPAPPPLFRGTAGTEELVGTEGFREVD